MNNYYALTAMAVDRHKAMLIEAEAFRRAKQAKSKHDSDTPARRPRFRWAVHPVAARGEA